MTLAPPPLSNDHEDHSLGVSVANDERVVINYRLCIASNAPLLELDDILVDSCWVVALPAVLATAAAV